MPQGEIFGLAVDAVNHETGWLHVGCQVKVANGHLVFGLPKRSKERDVPLSQHVAQVLKEHSEKFPPVDVTLPWLLPNEDKCTQLFNCTNARLASRYFATIVWSLSTFCIVRTSSGR